MHQLRKALRLATRQHGVIARFQLEELGIPLGSRSRILRNNFFEKKTEGIYGLVDSEKTWHHRAAIAVFSCGRHALLSHQSALINLELLDERDRRSRRGALAGIHVTSRREEQFDRNIIYHRSEYLEDNYPSIVCKGIPQVTIEHAIIDSAMGLTDHQLSSVVDKAFRLNHTNPEKLKHALQSFRAAPGREKHRLTLLLAKYLYSPNELKKIESELEARVLRVLRKHFHFEVQVQHEVNVHGRRYRLDLAILEKRIAIEIDGFEFHRDRNQFDTDRRRQNGLIAARWSVIRITATFSDVQIIDTVSGVLAALEG